MFRKISYLCCFILIGSSFTNATDILDDVCKAISTGNAEKVAVYFGPKVDISLGGSADGKQSKTDAEKLLKEFFTKSPVKTFTIQHRGPKSNGTSFVIGQYITTSGSSFRVTIYIKETGGQSTIQEMSFEKN